jgi:hypothetical protein
MTNKETGVKLGKHSKIRFGEFDNVFKGAEGVEWLLKALFSLSLFFFCFFFSVSLSFCSISLYV